MVYAQTSLISGLCVAVVFFVAPTRAIAHHGVGAQFDLSQTIELQGEIKELIWRNPHVRLTVSVVDASGDEILWAGEGMSIPSLRQREVTEVLLDVGDQITLAGNPAHDGENELYVTNVLLPNGREVLFTGNAEPRWQGLVMGSTGPAFETIGDASLPELGLFRVWSVRQPRIWQNFDFEIFPLSAEARAEGEAYDRLSDAPRGGECAPPGMPQIVTANPYPRDFVDRGDTILMRLEHYDTIRTIHLTPLPSNTEPLPSPLGYSVGHWNDDTLAVTTTKISDGKFRLGISLSENVETVERFTVIVDGSRLDYQMTVIDPTVLLEPAEFETHWVYIPGISVESFDCFGG